MKIETEKLNLLELSIEEMQQTNGGESAWYYVAYYSTKYVQGCNAVYSKVWECSAVVGEIAL